MDHVVFGGMLIGLGLGFAAGSVWMARRLWADLRYEASCRDFAESELARVRGELWDERTGPTIRFDAHRSRAKLRDEEYLP
jgi:hypothetical protein